MKIPSELEKRLQPVVDVFIQKKKFEGAIEALLSVKNNFSDFHIIDYYLGICYINLLDYERGIPYMDSIKLSNQLSPVQIVQANLILGLVYSQQKELDKAETVIKYAITLNPQSSMGHSALGYVYYLAKRYPDAIRFFKLAIELDPNNAGAHNNLGYTYAEIGINVNESIREARKAVALNRNSAAYRDSLGWAYYAAGQYSEAVKELQKALELDSGNPAIGQHLKEAIQKRDRHKKK
jgi:tetratricopeptide (TPR) repeat protein